MTRTRSEYRLSPIQTSGPAPELHLELDFGQPDESQRNALAALMLDAYRNTIDDEGEDLADALVAVDHYFAWIVRPHSFVVFDGTVPVAFSFVVLVNDLHYIDPVVVSAERKRRQVGRTAVQRCLQSLADAGVGEVGATITDGNIASEALFIGLGFSRHGSWP